MIDNENLTPENPAEPTAESTQPVPPQYAPPDYTAAARNAGADYKAPQEQPIPPGYAPPQYTHPEYAQNPNPNPNPAPQGYPAYDPQQATYYKPRYDTPPAGYQQKSRLAAGLLGVLFGMFGIHNFYLGFNTRAIIQLVVTLAGGALTCGAAAVAMEIWGLIEGVQLISGNPSRMYDGNGVITRE